jgi:hypothetical protein
LRVVDLVESPATEDFADEVRDAAVVWVLLFFTVLEDWACTESEKEEARYISKNIFFIN